VVTSTAGTTGVLDGFTITHGNANGTSTDDMDRGGGLIFLNGANPTVRRCRVIHNRVVFGGGGMYLRAASPTFVDVVFETNFGASFGGAIDMFSGCAPVFRACSFIGNTAARAGGVEVFGSSTPTLVNCLFRGNSATGAGGGGAMFIASNSNPTIRNCTIAFNNATAQGGGLLFSASAGTLGNCIVWGNTGPGGGTVGQQLTTAASANVQYSIVQGGFIGTGNLTADPLFLSTTDLRLSAGSPAIDAGSNALVPAGTTTDLAGLPRFVDDPATPNTGVGTPPLVDLGAYEFQAPAACYANCDQSTAVPALNVNDFICFQAAFAAGASYANCDLSTAVPLLNVNDFICFQSAFVSGCP